MDKTITLTSDDICIITLALLDKADEYQELSEDMRYYPIFADIKQTC
mgnify:CR=1 FL=1